MNIHEIRVTPLLDVERPTKQQLFDAVVEHAAQMPRQCMSVSGYCLYRGPDGNACFIGGLMTDEEAPGEEIASVNNLAAYRLLPPRLAWKENLDLLVELQDVHDEQQPEDWPLSLREVARGHRLDSSSVDRCFPKT